MRIFVIPQSFHRDTLSNASLRVSLCFLLCDSLRYNFFTTKFAKFSQSFAKFLVKFLCVFFFVLLCVIIFYHKASQSFPRHTLRFLVKSLCVYLRFLFCASLRYNLFIIKILKIIISAFVAKRIAHDNTYS